MPQKPQRPFVPHRTPTTVRGRRSRVRVSPVPALRAGQRDARRGSPVATSGLAAIVTGDSRISAVETLTQTDRGLSRLPRRRRVACLRAEDTSEDVYGPSSTTTRTSCHRSSTSSMSSRQWTVSRRRVKRAIRGESGADWERIGRIRRTRAGWRQSWQHFDWRAAAALGEHRTRKRQRVGDQRIGAERSRRRGSATDRGARHRHGAR